MRAPSRTFLLERGPRLVLALFVVGILVAAGLYRGHSVESLDQRTYLQMVHAVADHGTPSWDNGPIDRFDQLIVFWGIPVKDRVWGIYGLLYAYLAVPAFQWGGVVGLSRFSLATLAPQAIVSWALARRLVTSEWYATLAALLSVLSTPLFGKALEITAYPLFTLLATLAMYATARAVTAKVRPAVSAALVGVAWGVATLGHALCFAMGLGAFAVLALAPDPATGTRSAKGAALRVVPAFAAFVVTLLPASFVNHVRFRSYNPISYGYFPWSGPPKMTIVDQAQYGLPVAAFGAIVLVALFFARKRRAAIAGVLVVALAAVLLVPILRERAGRYVMVAFGYVVAAGAVDLGPPFELAKDGLGRTLGSWVVKGTLQCTPLLVLAPIALRGAGQRRSPLLAILIPSLALYASLTARANLINIDALGWPWVYARYTLPALPGLVVASVVVVERTRLRLADVAIGAAIGAVLTIVLVVFTDDDASFAKRFVVLVVPLLAAAAAVVGVLRREASRATAAIVAVVVGLGIGVGLGHDLRAHADGKKACDDAVDRFVSVMPRRFAVLGSIGPMDVYLTTIATHDVRYADVDRLPKLADHRPLVDHWRSEGRPIYLVPRDPEPTSPWPDVTLVRVERLYNVWRLDFR